MEIVYTRCIVYGKDVVYQEYRIKIRERLRENDMEVFHGKITLVCESETPRVFFIKR